MPADPLTEAKRILRGTNCFAFERGGRFFLYRRGEAGERNSLVLIRTNGNAFIKAVNKAINPKEKSK